MKLLIIEDDENVARITVDLLLAESREFAAGPQIGAIEVVSDLAAALERLEDFDAVLCDGEFPTRPGRLPRRNWSTVTFFARHCLRRLRCVVYSGDSGVVWEARRCGLTALDKPAPVEQIYAALVGGESRQEVA
jgi:CheY-like chemotaxis protein